MIKINNLTKIYHTPTREIVALEKVDLEVEKGEIFGIIGLSGAGKSTLVRCINMLEKPTRVRLLLMGPMYRSNLPGTSLRPTKDWYDFSTF